MKATGGFCFVGDVGLCTEGTIGLSPGFQPREHVHINVLPVKGRKVFGERRSIWSTPAQRRIGFYRPFGAGRFTNRHLGLKPQAESYSPFGTK